MIMENETYFQQIQRCTSYLICCQLRLLFSKLHSYEVLDDESMEELKAGVTLYRALKTLFHISTISPSSAAIFFEVLPEAKDAMERGIAPGAYSGQSGERINASHKRE